MTLTTGRPYWSDRAAVRVKPAEVSGNMGFRARVWRALVDWSWGIDLSVSIPRRLLWVWRRLTQ